MTVARVHDERVCLLGEGALWHPEREELWWFDILGRMLHGPGASHRLPELSSAMGWIDRDAALVARRGALVRLDLSTGAAERVAGLDEGNPVVRSNDGRADPWGGFWIGTMGLKAEKGAGAIWRYWRGEVRRLVGGVTIPNAICFSPGGWACWTDTEEQVVWRQPLRDADGFPTGEPEAFLDFRGTPDFPDGAVMDAEGTIWIAFWGEGKVAGFAPDGTGVGEFRVPAAQSTCPAIGADGTLYVTSAAGGLPQATLAGAPESGRTFAVAAGLPFAPEPRVVL